MAETTTTTQNAGNAGAAPQTPVGPDLVALNARIDELAKQNKILADTIAASKPVDEAGILSRAEAKARTAAGETLDARQASDAATAKKTAARQAVLDGQLKEVFAKVPELVQLPDTDDPEKLKAAADKIVARARELKLVAPDVGGATKDGGTPPTAGNPPIVSANLSEGMAKVAAAIQAGRR